MLEKLLFKFCEKFDDKIDIEVVNPLQLLSFSNIIFSECGDRLKFLFLNKITSNICISDIIQPDSIEHIILKICFSITDFNQRIIILRSLVSIKLHGVLRKISTLPNIGSDIIEIVDVNIGTINFSVYNLLGGIDGSINQTLDEALNNLKTLHLGSISIIISSLGMDKPRDIQNIITRLINKLQTNTIENGDQLAFICIISKGNEYPDFKQRDYFVNTKSGKQPIKHKSFFKNICDFIPEEKILLKEYNSFFDLLKINAKGVFHINGTIFQTMPFLNEYRQLVIHGVQSLTLDQQVQLWRFLFNEWKELNEPTNINLPSGIDSWKNILGLDIHKLITDDDYSLDQEKIPYSLLYEYGLSDASSIKSFLRALGANSNFSAVVSTRKYFETKIGSINMNMTNTQLIQTLKWISIKEIEVDNDDIGPFYRHLHNIRATLSYFPAYFPHTVKQKIVSIEGNTNVYHILEKDLIQARQYKIGISDIVNKLSFPLINLQILKDWSAYLQFNNRTKSLNITWDNLNYHLINTNCVEWNYHFYNTWKENYPNYKVLQYDGVEIPKQIEVAGQPLGLYNSGIVYQSDDKSSLYVANSTIEILLNTIVNNSYIFDSTARAYLKNCYSDQERQFENYIQIAKKDSEFESILRLRAEEIKLEEERFENANNINDSTSKYTYKWFLSLLELVRVQDKRTKVPELTFFKCQNVSNSNETFELSEYNGLIPSNIESIDEIPAQVIFLSKKNEQITENTTIHASKKQLKLWVIFPDINILSALKNAKKIISVKLLFPQNQELIQKLKNGFLRLNYKEDKNLYEDLSKNIDFVFGPPGTGKTTKLAKDIISFVSGNLINSIIVLTPTNKAADVLTLRIIDQLVNAPKWLFRIGTCTEPKLIKHGVVKSENDIELNSTFSQVIVTTIHRFSYFEVAVNKSNKIRLCDYKWSKVIFDEASMIPVSYITHAIHSSNQLNGNTHFIVSGDPLQIPPVFDLITEDLDQDIADKLQEENIYSMIGLNSFDSNIQKTIPNYGTRIQNLEIQHRSISPIGELFSKFQYQSKLTHSRDNKSNGKKHKKLPQGLVDLGFKPITIIRYPVKSGDSIYKPKKLDKSPIHLYSALLVHEIIKKFEEELTKVSKKGETWSIGILSPYRSQADLLLKLIETQFKRTDYLNFNVDTVHGFQGDENNIVFAVFNPSGSGSNISYSRFLKKEFILNVAISRAEDYLIMLIPDDDSDGINQLPLIKNLIKLSRETNKEYFSEIKSSDIEKKIMGATKFFESQSFTTAHQKVNIYGKPDLRYIIKLNENSLDIHWDL